MPRSLDAILSDVTALASEYYELTQKPLGVTGEVAECKASALLGLELKEARSAGYDAIRRHGGREEKIQIKGRFKQAGEKWGRVPNINIEKDFDVVMLVMMRGKYEVFEIWEASRSDVLARLSAPGSKARNERGSMDVSQFKSIARKIWPT